MLVKPKPDVTTALARIAMGAEWKVIEGWLLECREAMVQTSLSDDGVKCRKAQGALLAIDELLRNTRSAVELSTRR